MQLGEGLSLVRVLPPPTKKKWRGGLNLHLKWHIVGFGDRARPKKPKAAFYLFVLIVQSVLALLLTLMDPTDDRRSFFLLLLLLLPSPQRLCDCLCLFVWGPAYVATA